MYLACRTAAWDTTSSYLRWCWACRRGAGSEAKRGLQLCWAIPAAFVQCVCVIARSALVQQLLVMLLLLSLPSYAVDQWQLGLLSTGGGEPPMRAGMNA